MKLKLLIFFIEVGANPNKFELQLTSSDHLRPWTIVSKKNPLVTGSKTAKQMLYVGVK